MWALETDGKGRVIDYLPYIPDEEEEEIENGIFIATGSRFGVGNLDPQKRPDNANGVAHRPSGR